MRKTYSDVAEFHHAFGFPVLLAPEPVMDRAEADLRHNLIGEENSEVQSALASVDLGSTAGELADLNYVTVGTALSLGLAPDDHLHSVAGEVLDGAVAPLVAALEAGDHIEAARAVIRTEIAIQGVAAVLGIPMDQVHAEVHRSNMAKLWPDGRPRIEERGDITKKVIKPSSWTPPDVLGVLQRAGVIIPAFVALVVPGL